MVVVGPVGVVVVVEGFTAAAAAAAAAALLGGRCSCSDGLRSTSNLYRQQHEQKEGT